MKSRSSKIISFYLLCVLLFGSTLIYSNNYADLDYKTFIKSKHASSSWNDSVKSGFLALDNGKYHQAIEFLKDASNLGCNSPIVSFKLALAYEAINAYYSAVQYYEIALDQFQSGHKDHRYYKDFYANYGRALLQLGQKEKAYDALRIAAKKKTYPWVLKALGAQAVRENKADQTLSYFTRLLNHPENELTNQEKSVVYLLLARTYRNEDNKNEAKNYYNKLKEIDPNNREAHSFLRNTDVSIPLKANKELESVLELLDLH